MLYLSLSRATLGRQR